MDIIQSSQKLVIYEHVYSELELSEWDILVIPYGTKFLRRIMFTVLWIALEQRKLSLRNISSVSIVNPRFAKCPMLPCNPQK